MNIERELNTIFSKKSSKVRNILNDSPVLPKHVALSIYTPMSKDTELDDSDLKHAQEILDELHNIHSKYVCAYLKNAKPLPLTHFRNVTAKDVEALKKQIANL